MPGANFNNCADKQDEIFSNKQKANLSHWYLLGQLTFTKERGEGFNECKHALPLNLGATDVFNAVLWSYIF